MQFGNSVMPLVFLIISSAINVVLDIVFITQFSMGVQVQQFATVIAQAISAVLCFVYIYFKAPLLIPQRKHFHVGNKCIRSLQDKDFLWDL